MDVIEAAPQEIPDWGKAGIKVVRAGELDCNTPQTEGMSRAAAITTASAGARKLWAGTVTVQPNAKTGPHHHGEVETVIFVVKGRVAIIQEKAVFGAPDLVVEMLSPSTAARDRGLKKDLYARSGVQCYWLLDPRRLTLQALHLEHGLFRLEANYTGAATFRPSLFPGLTIRLAEVWVQPGESPSGGR